MTEDDDKPGELRLVCHTCAGEGHLLVARAATLGGASRTVLSPNPCPHCGERGRLSGFHPPG